MTCAVHTKQFETLPVRVREVTDVYCLSSLMSYLHRLSVLFASTLVSATNRLFDENTEYSAIQHFAKSATFTVIRLKNEAMSYLHGLSVLSASLLIMATNRLFDVNTGYNAIQHFTKGATFLVVRLKNEAMSFTGSVFCLLCHSLQLQMACLM